jgi:hypothetical protein
MVTSSHEAAHRIFQDRPELLNPVFRILGLRAPDKALFEVLTPDVTEIRPMERRVDTVMRVEPADGTGPFLLAIEAQGRRDENKPASWGYYLSYLSSKYRCPTLLLVICQDSGTAEWAAGPFRNGWGGWTASSVHPLALGPDNVPLITDAQEAARDLALAAFAAIVHGANRKAPAILEALARAIGSTDHLALAYYSEMLDIGLGNTPARDIWRKLMKNGSFFPGRGTFVEETFLEGKAEGVAEGKAEGKAEAVLQVLAHRGIAVSDEARERIAACRDMETLERWFDKAFSVEAADELLAAG